MIVFLFCIGGKKMVKSKERRRDYLQSF